MRIGVKLLCSLVISVTAIPSRGADGRHGGAPEGCEKYGFRFVVPPAWHSPFASRCSRFTNYPDALFPGAGQLPPGGAEIDVLDEILLPGDTPSPSLRAWMERELRRAGLEPEADALSVPKETGVAEAIITKPFRWDSQWQKQSGQDIYFRVGVKRLEVRAFWRTGDPKAARYQEALLFLVRNMRPVAGRGQRP